MFKRGDKEFDLEVWFVCQNILNYTKGMIFDDFVEDKKIFDVIVRNIKIFGEVVKNVLKEFQEKYSEVEWSIVVRIWDKLIHFYFDIEVEVVRKITKENLSDLEQKLKEIIKQEG